MKEEEKIGYNRGKGETILLVDDAEDTLEVLQRNLTGQGYRVLTSSGVYPAIGILDSTPVDLVITDYKMPEKSGLDLVKHIRENFRDVRVMMITGYATVEGAVEAVRTGAEEYLAKPFTHKELLSSVRKVLDRLRDSRKISGTGEMPTVFYGLIGESEPMKKIFRAIKKASSTSATVLIAGESGTGKELVARAIHYNSSRMSAPFVPVNCGAIPEDLMESQLFGHIKGAFTGAGESRAGFFQTADGGTIFLDEVSNTGLSMQAKLLRVLQDKEVYMVGSIHPRKVDVRIITASNKDLSVMVKKNLFREDLFYRLNVIAINLPPLRERGDDILILSRHFCDKFSKEMGIEKEELKISEDVFRVFREYSWPGNVRELENLIQRMVVMSEGNIIDIPDLPPYMRSSLMGDSRGGGYGLNKTLTEVEIDHIRNVLSSVGGNKTRAAEILAIDRKTLRDKMKKGKISGYTTP